MTTPSALDKQMPNRLTSLLVAVIYAQCVLTEYYDQSTRVINLYPLPSSQASIQCTPQPMPHILFRPLRISIPVEQTWTHHVQSYNAPEILELMLTSRGNPLFCWLPFLVLRPPLLIICTIIGVLYLISIQLRPFRAMQISQTTLWYAAHYIIYKLKSSLYIKWTIDYSTDTPGTNLIRADGVDI